MKNKLLLALSFITLITICLLIFIGKNFYIEFNMSKEDIILEYNQEYELNKPRASLLGKYILKEGYEIPVTSSNNVDNTKLGEYEITYHSKFMFWEDSAKTKVFAVINIDIVNNNATNFFILKRLSFVIKFLFHSLSQQERRLKTFFLFSSFVFYIY